MERGTGTSVREVAEADGENSGKYNEDMCASNIDNIGSCDVYRISEACCAIKWHICPIARA